MFNIHYRLNLILKSLEIIERRMKKIQSPDDFIKNDENDTVLDSVNARLQSIGENVNKITKAEKDFFDLQLQIDPLPIINFSNIISHEYELLDYQVIYKICVDDIPLLKQKIQTFLSDNNEVV